MIRPSGEFYRVRARLAALALAVTLAALAPSGVQANGAEPVPRATTAFQRSLDRAGVPLSLPAHGKVIIVNIPSFELTAVTDGRPVLRSRVIVGTPGNPTPVGVTYTTTVRFLPTWRPTPDMVASGEYEDRVWKPGPTNPLGLAAVRLGPGLLVYLHDTNHRELFDRDYRALSHGCIRVQQWDALIAWLLDWDLAQVHTLAQGRRTLDVPAPQIPVVLGYYLRFPDQDGTIWQYGDVYGRSVSGPVAGAVAAEPGPLELACAAPMTD